MADITTADLIKLVTAVAAPTGATAAAAVKWALNGTRKRIDGVSRKVDERNDDLKRDLADVRSDVKAAVEHLNTTRIDVAKIKVKVGLDNATI